MLDSYQAMQELKTNFKMFDNYITEDNVYGPFESIYSIYSPKKIESQLTIFIVYDLETHNKDKARPYNLSLYRFSN